MDEHTLHLRPPVWVLIAAVVIAGGAYISGKYVETRDREPVLITVSGDGKVSAVPDIAELSFGVRTERLKTAQLAMEKLRQDMSSAFEAVKAVGIEEKDIRTEFLSLNPAYDWIDGRQILKGYEASQSLRVKVRDLEKIGDVLAAATSKGANQAGDVSFTIDDPLELQAQAREKAIVEAQEKARELADQLDMRIKKLRGFSEGGGYIPPMPFYRKDMMMEVGMGGAVEAPPIPAGEQEVAVQVTLTYELK